MRKQYKSISIILVLAISLVGAYLSAFFLVSTASNVPDLEPLKYGPELRKSFLPIHDERAGGETLKTAHDGVYWEVGDVLDWIILDDYQGYYTFDYFELRAMNDLTEIWVQLDRSYQDGDPRNDPTYQDAEGRYHYPEVTDAQVEYLLNEYTFNIFDKDTDYYGMPDNHDGSYAFWPDYAGSDRNVILVSNVRDEAYYDITYPYYIAGFYSPTIEYYLDRNVISIDSHQWYRRIGPEGYVWHSEILDIDYPPVDRPNLYEGTIAHEYQHLIHDDYNPDSPSFMNEACSMYAELLCDYPIDWGSIDSFLFTPDNSLTQWSDQGNINILADYGSSFLWGVYLNDQFDPYFLGQYTQGGIPGIVGVEELLPNGYDFNKVYHNWKVANLIHSDKPGHGKYNYKSIDLADAGETLNVMEVAGHEFPWTPGVSLGTTHTILGYDTGVSMLGPYGSDYLDFTDLSGVNLLLFDGDEESIYGWQMTEYGWYSGAANLLNSLLIGDAYVDPADPWLEIYTYWDIEDYWDFGFVQVSTDDGNSWTSLENEYTTWDYDPNAHPDVVANLPGLTGYSGGFLTLNFNLSVYAGQNVKVAFRYVTDWYTVYEGWYIASATVSGVDLTLTPTYPPAEFQVTIVDVLKLPHDREMYIVREMYIFDFNNFGLSVMFDKKWKDTIVIISTTMELGFTDYQFKVI